MTLPTLPHCWRVSRYESVLRTRDGGFESWTDVSDIGKAFNGLVLSRDEYMRVESTYIAAAIEFAVAASAETFRIAHLGYQNDSTTLSDGQSIVRSDLGPVVRANLRGELDCVLEAAEGGLQLAFGYDLYMYVASRVACSAAAENVERLGLYLEPGVAPAYWEEDRG